MPGRRVDSTTHPHGCKGRQWGHHDTNTPPEDLNIHSLKQTAKAPEMGFFPKRSFIIFQPSIFRCELLAAGSVEPENHGLGSDDFPLSGVKTLRFSC